jgi:O-antigen ligase
LEAAEQRLSASVQRRLESLDVFCERGILGIIIVALIYAVLAFGGVRTPDFVIIQGLIMVGLGLWLVRVWTKPRFRLLWPPMSWAVLAFVLYAIVRCLTDNLHYPARHELSSILTYASLFFLASNNLTRRNSATVISMALVCLALGISALAIYQFATHTGNIWGLYKPTQYLARASGTFVNPNHLAGFLELVVPLAIAYMFMGRLPITAKVLLAYCSLMMITAICMSLSRGGMLVTGITLTAVFVALLFQRDFWLKAVVCLVLVAALIGGAFTQVGAVERRFGKLFDDSGKVEDARVRLWHAGKEIYVKQPVLGPGPGHFDYEFRQYAPRAWVERAQYAHNDYLNALCDWGAVGLFLILGCCGLLYYGVVRTWPFVRKQPNELGSMRSNKGALVFGAAFSIFAILLHSFTDFNLHIPSNAMLSVVLAGLLTAHWRFATEKFWLNPRVIGKLLLTACVIAVAVYVSKQASIDREEWTWLDRAEQIENYSTEKQSVLMHAWNVAPDNYQTAYELGEIYRLESWQGHNGYEKSAQEAMTWYDRAMTLNPYDPYTPMRYGMCLDWLDKHSEAAKYFEKAQRLAPNDFTVLTYLAWHQMQIENWKEADKILRDAMTSYWTETAAGYLELVQLHLSQPSLLKH